MNCASCNRSPQQIPLWQLPFANETKPHYQCRAIWANNSQNFRSNVPKIRFLHLCPAWLENCQIRQIICVYILEFVFSLKQLQLWSKVSEILNFWYYNANRTAGSDWLYLKVFRNKTENPFSLKDDEREIMILKIPYNVDIPCCYFDNS